MIAVVVAVLVSLVVAKRIEVTERIGTESTSGAQTAGGLALGQSEATGAQKVLPGLSMYPNLLETHGPRRCRHREPRDLWSAGRRNVEVHLAVRRAAVRVLALLQQKLVQRRLNGRSACQTR